MPFDSRTRSTRAKVGGEKTSGNHDDQLGRTMEYLGSVGQDQLRRRLAYLEGETALLRSLLSAVEARDAAAEAVRQEAAKKSPGPGANPEKERGDHNTTDLT